MRGRKPAPKAIKEVKGERKSRINQHEPAPLPAASLDPPAGLDEIGRAKWSELLPRLIETRVWSETDREALTTLCQAVSRHAEAQKQLATRGYWTKDANGIHRAAPWLTVAQKETALILRILAEFGFTPASRTRVKTSAASQDEAKPTDVLAELRKRRARSRAAREENHD